MEVGPWRFDGKDSFKQKEGGWEEYANVLYCEFQEVLTRSLTYISPIRDRLTV